LSDFVASKSGDVEKTDDSLDFLIPLYFPSAEQYTLEMLPEYAIRYLLTFEQDLKKENGERVVVLGSRARPPHLLDILGAAMS